MDDFDRLLKDALDSDIDLEGLTVDEDLVASTLKAIDEAAPRKEEIRAEFDQEFAAVAAEEVATETVSEEVPEEATAVVTPMYKKERFFTGRRIATIAGVVAGIAAVVVGAIFLGSGMNLTKKSEDASTTTAMSTATEDRTESAAESYEMKGAAVYDTEAPASPVESATFDVGAAGMAGSAGNGGYGGMRSGVNGMVAADGAAADAASEEDGLYYFDDDEYYIDQKAETSDLLNNVFMLGDKDLYKPILDAVRAVAEGEPEVSNPMQYSAESEEAEEPAAGDGDGSVGVTANDGSSMAAVEPEADEAEEEEFDINDPVQLKEALEESQQMLKETGGGPSDKATEVIGSIEVNGETVPDFEYSPEKNPFWVEIGDASDEALSEYSPLIVIYDQDNEADFDVCVQVYTDRCVVYDFAFGTTTTYTVADGQALADTLREIVGQ
jgi:hypothetical protein